MLVFARYYGKEAQSLVSKAVDGGPLCCKKYINLVTELNRQSGLLGKIQGIKPTIQSSITDKSKSNKEQDDLVRLREDEDGGLSYNVLKQKSLIRRQLRLIMRSTQDQASKCHWGKGEGLNGRLVKNNTVKQLSAMHLLYKLRASMRKSRTSSPAIKHF
ncbi:hypothetical protein PPACK8108_LOCUS5369 [Phakopsora pachyrhizi]|uniref:Uncharacterized protein n=1 Tax=Phakopsora pachyrhizi TaxID=170000 RepID=A0AAV0AQI5_PHAPC|nr:hypothetical protein PPACK8108_LOCUS5369 [Phakopsora pachyrhizi]